MVTDSEPLTDEELIDRARKHVPPADRRKRYAGCPRDVNDNWDLTRALLRQVDTVQGQLNWAKRKNLVLLGIVGGATTEMAKILGFAVLKHFHWIS